MILNFYFNKQDIFELLARTTGYIGSKKVATDPDAYLRIALNEGDEKLMSAFWGEARDVLCLTLRNFITAEGWDDDVYRLKLQLSKSFDTTLESSLKSDIANYFVQYIASRWLAITEPDKAQEYGLSASSVMSTLTRKVFNKRPPLRPQYRA